MSEGGHLMHDRILALTGDGVHSKKRLFERAAAAVSDAFELDGEAVYKALLGREKLGSTAMGEGIAIPHCRIPECADSAGCLITLPQGIEFNAPDGQLVDLVFVLLVPIEANEQHLGILAELAKAFSSADLRSAMRSAPSAFTARTILIERMNL
jgi:PTS system nitrogen regulatory IIA component